jgi:DNA polymerase-3 subunit gamma/tau
VCSDCREIAAGTSVDVLEIDGASNNGVEAVREIREQVKFLPSSGTRKIYIIDEVHMLTTAAFNALLKTLEEPPPHVVFVFATTEPHKIPATILSRCQRFDLKRVGVAEIEARLRKIAEAEEIQADDASFQLLSRAAEGSMRDALSLLDQVISFCGKNLVGPQVRESIGLIPGQMILKYLEGIFRGDPNQSLEVVSDAYRAGHDLKLFGRTLMEYLHAGMLLHPESGTASHPHRHEWMDLDLSEQEEFQRFLSFRKLSELEIFFQVFQFGMEALSRSPHPRWILDVLAIKCGKAPALVSAHQGGVVPPAPVALSPQAPQAPQAVPLSPKSSAPLKTAAPAPQAILEKTVTPARSWSDFIEFVRPKRPLLATILEHGRCDEFPSSQGILVLLGEGDHYYRDQLQAKTFSDQVHQLVEEYLGKAYRVQYELRAGVQSAAVEREENRMKHEAKIRAEAQAHPLIQEAKALFGVDVGPIEIVGAGEEGHGVP